ncbi:MAG: TRAP transporter substrate-binding protein [Thermoleophilia bacterium]
MITRAKTATTAALLAAGAVALGSAAASGAGPATSQQATVTLKLGYVTTAAHPYGLAVNAYIQKVKELSGGRIVITGQPNYPQAETQLLSDVRSGTEDMGTISTAIWDSAGIKSFQALQAPMLITNYTLEGKVLRGRIGKQMIAAASAKAGDVKVLAIHEGGLRKPLGVKPVNTFKSFQGLKIRTAQSRVQQLSMKALGADPNAIPLPEVYQGLQNGTFDAMEANLGLIFTNKYYEVAKYVTANINLWPFPTALTINKAKFNSLSAADQKVLTDAASQLADTSLSIVSAPSVLPQKLVNCGVQFLKASPSDLKKFGKAADKGIALLSRDKTNAKFITAIQKLKAKTKAPTPDPLPTTATGSCGS